MALCKISFSICMQAQPLQGDNANRPLFDTCKAGAHGCCIQVSSLPDLVTTCSRALKGIRMVKTIDEEDIQKCTSDPNAWGREDRFLPAASTG